MRELQPRKSWFVDSKEILILKVGPFSISCHVNGELMCNKVSEKLSQDS